ncbi:putative Phosphotransferase enzyme family [gamma proteobacterium NOR5-3]|nr:putative Phosphotransferase enzyme family [gamma proteobacterium NOR5-3]
MEAVAQQLASTPQDLVDEVCGSFALWAPQLSRAPVPGDVLSGGYNHHVQLLQGQGQCWVLRIDRRIRDASQRELEAEIHREAAASNIAPRLDYSDPQRGVTIMEWIDGQRDNKSAGENLAGLLRCVHALTPRGQRIESCEVLNHYRALLAADGPLAGLLRAASHLIDPALKTIGTADNVKEVLCHNDLLSANRLQRGDRLYALDWEYAGVGDPLFDLAVCASELSGNRTTQLLERYLMRPPTPAETMRFEAQRLIYACIEACWFNVHQTGAPEAAQAHQKLAALLQRGNR